ncbi:imidazolonepropionase [Peribacillus kribbensis]|uniref:imidazolonepropionase n=1 Tax=Peribacillus kribbensis TaxID=356658 RepID=UPI00041FDDFC|nr:imidazolonepropionase [Peribacillus kribbensis]
MNKPIFIRNANQLVSFKGSSHSPLTGRSMENLMILSNGSVWIEKGRIADAGEDSILAEKFKDRIHEASVIDAEGKLVTPGLVDPHTHLIHSGTREEEFNRRLHGASYMEIMESGGGIHATAAATQKADIDQLISEGLARLDSFLLHGVTTLEAKSGYGLTLEQEIKQLEAAASLSCQHPIDIVHTFMGAHAIPKRYKDKPDQFVDLVSQEMIPEIAKRGLAEFNDVFCERGVFTPEQTRKILRAGIAHGLIPKIHADEIEPYGGAELAAEMGAISADHLLRASDYGIEKMAERGVTAVLLPGTALFLMTDPVNGRKMIDRGVPVALATDFNPGSSPTVSLGLIMNLGCLRMGMSPAEVLAAATINAAHAINRGRDIGSIEKGKKADIVLFNVPNYLRLQYEFGVNHVHTVIKEGEVVVENGKLVRKI